MLLGRIVKSDQSALHNLNFFDNDTKSFCEIYYLKVLHAISPLFFFFCKKKENTFL